jgi:hypothetical protein
MDQLAGKALKNRLTFRARSGARRAQRLISALRKFYPCGLVRFCGLLRNNIAEEKNQ